jgi:hypothetical protein
MAHLVALHQSHHTTTTVARLMTAASAQAADVIIPAVWQHLLQTAATTGTDNADELSCTIKLPNRGHDLSNFTARATGSSLESLQENESPDGLTYYYPPGE